MQSARIVALALAVVSLISCKSEQGASAAASLTDGNRDASRITGECAVSKIKGAETEMLNGLSGVLISRPRKGADGNTEIKFVGAAAINDMIVDAGLDLYDRKGELARLSGAIGEMRIDPETGAEAIDPETGEPIFDAELATSMKFDSTAKSQTGSMQLTWKGPKTVAITATLACKWSE